MSPSTSLQGLPQPGEVVAQKYRVDAMLGSGGIGVVLGATDLSLHRAVALKFLLPKSTSRTGVAERFHREARAVAALESEHVARVFEVATLPSGAPFIVMEHLRGCDLARLVYQRGALPIEMAVDYVLQTCEALSEAHGRGIVHRDLKPQNLFLTERRDGSPCVKVLDFGISKMDGDESVDLTSADTVMGTPQYMSPEQVRSLKEVDHRTDIWAMGAVLFYLLTGQAPFTGPTPSAVFANIAANAPPSLCVQRPNVPPALEAIVMRCLHKDPNGRFRDVAELAHALAPFATELGRFSAGRVSRIVHGGASRTMEGSNQPAYAVQVSHGPPPMYAPTTIPGSSRAPNAPMPMPMQPMPPGYGMHAPSTMGGVQNTHTFAQPQPRSSMGLIIGLGAGVLGIGLIAAAGFAAFHFGYIGSDSPAPVAAKSTPTTPTTTPAGPAVNPTTPTPVDPTKPAPKPVPGAVKPTTPTSPGVAPPGTPSAPVTPSATPTTPTPPPETKPPANAQFIYEPAYYTFSQNELAALRGAQPRIDKCVQSNGQYHAGYQITFWLENKSETAPGVITTSTGLPKGDETTRVCLANAVSGIHWEYHSAKRRWYYNL